MDDYYSPHPRWVLRRPLVVAGSLGTGARGIARGVAGRSGLPFVDVDRRIEHEAGASLSRLARDGGPTRVATEARRVLESVALERPAALVAIGVAWPSSDAARLFRRAMDFVRVRRSATVTAARRRALLEASPWVASLQACAEGRAVAPPDADLLSRAGIVLDAGDRHAHQIAELLMDELELVMQAERI